MTDIVKGMARVICLAVWDHDYTPRDPLHPDVRWTQAVRAAKSVADFMANNVSDEMGVAAVVRWQNGESKGCLQEWLQEAIAAAIRAAAGGE